MAFSIRTAIRRFIGTAQLEVAMSKITEQLTELKGQFSDFTSDVDARLAQLAEAQGTFTPEAQAIFDGLKADVTAADSKVGDADGSDTPAEPTDPAEPDAPVPAEPVTDGTEPTPVDAPVDASTDGTVQQ
jgi:hypothetical protein